MAFSDIKDANEITDYLRKVLSRPGGKKSETKLYHYTTVQTATAIVENHCIWLGSTDRMNDYLEGEFIQSSAGRTMHFVCFSKVEENLAMYKMYGAAPDGVMLSLSYTTASGILNGIPKSKSGKHLVNIVRDGALANNQIEADVYWSEVCYKDLHTDIIKVGGVENNNFHHPLTIQELAGYVKLYGWEYEKEVRLCADIGKPLAENERIAIKLPDDFEVSVVFGPGFDKTKNRSLVSKLKRWGVDTKDSEYDSLVDLGGQLPQDSRIRELEAENARLKKIIEENDLDDEEDVDYSESEWDWESGYHEMISPDGDILKAGIYEDGHLIDGTEFNIILKVCKGPVNHDYDYQDDPNEEAATLEDIKSGDFHYSYYGRYEGCFRLSIGYNDIIERGLEFFYIADKKVHLEGKQIKPTYTNFRKLEDFLAEKEPETLDEIRTGIHKYSETDYAEFDVE